MQTPEKLPLSLFPNFFTKPKVSGLALLFSGSIGVLACTHRGANEETNMPSSRGGTADAASVPGADSDTDTIDQAPSVPSVPSTRSTSGMTSPEERRGERQGDTTRTGVFVQAKDRQAEVASDSRSEEASKRAAETEDSSVSTPTAGETAPATPDTAAAPVPPRPSDGGIDTSSPGTASDNSGVNKRNTDVTAMDQSNDPRDIEITRQIRRSLTGNDALSTYARNVKIITRQGAVILKGPVRSLDEKETIEAAARKVAGNEQVTSEITISAR